MMPETLYVILTSFAVLLLVMLILRKLVLWYLRINAMVEYQEKMIAELKELNAVLRSKN